MENGRLTVSLAAVFAVVCLYYRGGMALLPALLLPVAAHELSHLFALRALGLPVMGVFLEPRGLCIRYTGDGKVEKQVLSALAGPLGGAIYAMAADRSGVTWLKDSAGLSLLLTAFNLLPILPLDGGRVFSLLCVRILGEERGQMLYRAVGRMLISLLLIGGVALAVWKKSTAPLAAAIWLLLFTNEETLVKSGKIR